MNTKNSLKLLEKIVKETDSNNAIIFAITERMIQLAAMYNLGRNLSDLELNRIIYAFEKPEFVLMRNELLAEIINSAIDIGRGRWTNEDQEYEEHMKEIM